MKLHRVRLRNFKGIADRTVKFRASGVNVITAPNETGKSSLIEGLDYLFKEYDDTTKKQVKAAKPIGRDVGPEVTAEIEAGPYRFIYHKRFCKSPRTVLHFVHPNEPPLTGRQAHHRVEEILEAHMDMDLFRGLRIVQGDSVDQPRLESGTLLRTVLDEAAGQAGAPENHESLMKAVELENSRYFDANGKPRGKLAELPSAIQASEAEVADLKVEMARFEEEARNHETATRDQVKRQGAMVALREQAATWKAKLEQARGIQGQLEAAAERLSEAQTAEAATRRLQDRRTQLVGQLKDLAERLELLSREVKAQEEKKTELERKVEGAREAVVETRRKLEEAKALQAIRENDKNALHTEFDARLLRERLTKAEQAQTELGQAEAVLASNRVDDKTLARLQELESALALAGARLEDASPTLRITNLGASKLKVDGKSVTLGKDESTSSPVANKAVVDVPGQVRVEVLAGTSLEDLKATHEEAKARFDAALSKAEIHDLQDARRANKERQDATATQKEAKRTIADALRKKHPEPFDSTEQLEAKVLELEARVSHLKKGRPAKPPLPSSRDDAKDLADKAGALVEEADEELKPQVREVEKLTEQANQVQLQLVKLRTQKDEAAGREKAEKAELAAGRASQPDAALAKALHEAESKLEDLKRKQADAKASAATADLASTELRAKASQDALDRAVRELDEVRDRISNAQGRLELHAEAGIFDRLDLASRRLDHQRGELERTRRQADAVHLLYVTISKHRGDAQQAYLAPLRGRIEALGRILFGSTFQVAMNADLSLSSCSRNGIAIPFDQLSTGTKEQLGLIVRLAIAQAVSRDQSGVPLIVDDALGYTDEDRLPAIGAAIDSTGQGLQVIILTCYPTRYQSVGNTQVVHLAEVGPDAELDALIKE